MIWRVALWTALGALVIIFFGIKLLMAEPIDKGAWFESLRYPCPTTSAPGATCSCCNISDCKEVDPADVDWRDGSWLAPVGGELTPIPNGKVLLNKVHPEGKAVVCANGKKLYCFVRPGMGS